MKQLHLVMVAGLGLVLGCEMEMERPVGERPPVDAPVLTMTDANFDGKVLESEKPVLVDFWATWCGPCRDMDPVIAELAVDFQDRAVIGKLDIDTNERIVSAYDVSMIPAFLFFKDGQLVDRVTGTVPKSQLADKLDALIESGHL